MWALFNSLTSSGEAATKQEESKVTRKTAYPAVASAIPESAETPKDVENKSTTKKSSAKTVKAVPIIKPKLNRPAQDVARDTKRILEICYGNGSSSDAKTNAITTATSQDNADGDTEVEVKHIELNPRPPKKKKKTTTSKNKKLIKKKKPCTDAHVEKEKWNGENGNATSTTKRRKKKKKSAIITVEVTETITNEDGTTTTITKRVKKKRRRRKKKKAPVKRDAAGRIIRRRKKIKNRHRVVKKELIKKGKDAKIDLETIQEGESSEEESSDSSYEYEDSTLGDTSEYTDITGSSTLSDGEFDDDDDDGDDDDDDAVYEGSDDEEDSDEEVGDDAMMVVYEDEEEEYDEEENELEGTYEMVDSNGIVETNSKAALHVAAQGDADTVGTTSTTGSQTAYLGTSRGAIPDDVEAQSSPQRVDSEQSRDSNQPNTNSDIDSNAESRKGILFWSTKKTVCAGASLVAIVAGLTILIIFLVNRRDKTDTTTVAPSMAPTIMETPAPSFSPSMAPTFEPTTILNTASTVCQLPRNESQVLVFQAEDAFLLGGTLLEEDGNNDTSGFCGDGFATDFTEETSSMLLFPLVVEQTGLYRVAIRFANGGEEDLPLQLYVDNEPFGGFTLMPTGNWSTWMVEGVDNVMLREGVNHTIELWTTEDRDIGPNVDWLSVRYVDPLTRFEYLVTILSPFTNVTAPDQGQISALIWMSTEDPIDWGMLSDRELIERYSLVTFYYAMEGNLWSNTNNVWLSKFHSCDWYGVSCSEDNFVTDIILDDNKLFGSIPSDFFILTSLVTVSMNTNSLEGTLGTDFAKLQNLTTLLLNANFLSGFIPEEIASMEGLKMIDLGANDLVGGIPESVYTQRGLESLVLASNFLYGPLSSNIGRLRRLQTLDLQNNLFTGELATQLGFLSNLQALILGFNQLSGTIPSELGQLTNLLLLDLNSNLLTGPVPAELGKLNNTVIDLYGNPVLE